MAVMFKVVPKVGPFRAIDFKEPTSKTEDLYFKSVDQTVSGYGEALKQVKNNELQTPEIDLDTGKPTKYGEYPLADVTYRELLDELAAKNFADMTPELRNSILNFYSEFDLQKLPQAPNKCVLQRRQQTYNELQRLRALQVPGSPAQARVEPTHPGGGASLPPGLN
jgi:hypothetical protein